MHSIACHNLSHRHLMFCSRTVKADEYRTGTFHFGILVASLLTLFIQSCSTRIPRAQAVSAR